MRHIIWVLATCVISSPLHAQEWESVSLNIPQLLRHGEWNAIDLNSGSELRILFLPEQQRGIVHAQVTVTGFFGLGPSTTLNFKGLLKVGATRADGKNIPRYTNGQFWGMPDAWDVCGDLQGVGYTCFITDVDLDGYIPGSGDSKLYNLVMRIGITRRPVNRRRALWFNGVMRNPIPLRIDADGTVVW